MSNAREMLALRQTLAEHLRPADLTRLAWPSIAGHADTAITRGWTGAELARHALLGAYSDGVRDPAAYLAATIRDCAQVDPPREVTPTPVAMSEHQKIRAQAIRDAAGVDHSGWVERIRGQHAARRRENAS